MLWHCASSNHGRVIPLVISVGQSKRVGKSQASECGCVWPSFSCLAADLLLHPADAILITMVASDMLASHLTMHAHKNCRKKKIMMHAYIQLLSLLTATGVTDQYGLIGSPSPLNQKGSRVHGVASASSNRMQRHSSGLGIVMPLRPACRRPTVESSNVLGCDH